METTGEQVSNQRHLARQIQSPAECALACNHLEECATFMFFPARFSETELRTSGKLIFSPHNYTSGWCPKGRKANLLNFEKGEKILVKIFYKKVVETTQQIPINSSASKTEVANLLKYFFVFLFQICFWHAQIWWKPTINFDVQFTVVLEANVIETYWSLLNWIIQRPRIWELGVS